MRAQLTSQVPSPSSCLAHLPDMRTAECLECADDALQESSTEAGLLLRLMALP